MPPRFEWDTEKAASNFAKHGVPFEEARTAFADPFASITDEPRHSVGELREVLMGLSDRGRLIVVMFTERGEAVRIISARQATHNERRNYEEAHP
jgi:uncharacterized DUF497 family protein